MSEVPGYSVSDAFAALLIESSSIGCSYDVSETLQSLAETRPEFKKVVEVALSIWEQRA